jgi:DNA-binding transcriptional MocR family regulator
MTDGWLPDLKGAPGSNYHVIADALDGAVRAGTLRAGDRLPPQREVAAKLSIDLTTVSRAYEVARQRGLIEARGRSGSFVRAQVAAERPEPVATDSGMNMPPVLPDKLLAREMTRTLGTLLGNAPARLHYQSPGGAPEDRRAGALLLAARGIPAEEDRVIVTAGGQNALHAILSTAFTPGDVIACGRYTYPGFRSVAERIGLRLLPLSEMRGDALAAAARCQPIRGLYVVPTNDNPTAETIPLEERQALAAAAKDHGIHIIEDDAYGPLASAPITPLAALAPELCWHIASTSKTLSPALRVAHVYAPDVGAALRLAVDVHETAIMAPPLNAAMVSAWTADGTHDRLVRAMRNEAVRRQRIAGETLKGLDYAAHPEGYHIWLPLPARLSAPALIDLMRPSGLSVLESARFAVGDDGSNAVRISLGGTISPNRLARALRLLHGYVTAPPTRAAAFV